MKPNRCGCGKYPEFRTDSHYASDGDEHQILCKCENQSIWCKQKTNAMFNWNYFNDGWVSVEKALPVLPPKREIYKWKTENAYQIIDMSESEPCHITAWRSGTSDTGWVNTEGGEEVATHWRDLVELPREH